MKTRYPAPVGQRFGRLLIVAQGGTDAQKRSLSVCRCDCGTVVHIPTAKILRADAKSCGCLIREMRAHFGVTTHGKARTPTYNSWNGMKDRCGNPRSKHYPQYGGRGIKVCARWHKFENFLADMGERPEGMTIDRKNNDGDYKPGNCRWATPKQQNHNKRNSVRLEFAGRSQSIEAWAEETGLAQALIRDRMRRGWSADRILTEPRHQYDHSRQ